MMVDYVMPDDAIDEMRTLIQPYFDKLAAYPTAKEIRDFLVSEEVAAVKGDPYACAIAEYVSRGCGLAVAVSHKSINSPCDPFHVMFTNTVAMGVFASLFDLGRYPELEA